MANGHGGARAGAGRPRNAEKYTAQIESATDQIVAKVGDRIAALELLAEGGSQTVHETWELAGLVVVDDVEIDKDGRVVKVKRLAFPNLPADQWVCVQRRVVRSGPSETANIYLVDRALGKTAQEVAISGPDGGPVEHAVGSLEEWKAQAQQRIADAAATYTLLGDDTEGDDA